MTHEEKVAAAEREAEQQAMEIYEQQQAQLKAGKKGAKSLAQVEDGPPTDLKDQAEESPAAEPIDKKQLQKDLADAKTLQEQQQRENRADQKASAQKKAV